MARFVSRPDLDSVMARTVGVRLVNQVKDNIESGARRRAPAGKVWITARDDRVRPSHVAAHDQLIPDNLRYRLRKMTYIRKGRDSRGRAVNPTGGWMLAAGWDLGREPRDPSLPEEQRVQCRCESQTLPGAVARTIHATQTHLEGTRVSAEVETRFPRAAESEFGTSQDRPAWFMTGGAREAAARLRAASAR